MQKKTKVVAFRVNDEEYEALVAQVRFEKGIPNTAVKTVAHLVEGIVQPELIKMVASLRKEKKNAEAAAKRAATKAAKKAANDAK